MNIQFSQEQENPKDSQLIIAISGSPEYIKERLQFLLKDCDSSYGKPTQGITCHGNGITDVITPIWKGKKY